MAGRRQRRMSIGFLALAVVVAAAGVVSATPGTNTSVLIGQGQVRHSSELQVARGTDIVVVQTPEDESKDYDAQLKTAVDDLMKRVK